MKRVFLLLLGGIVVLGTSAQSFKTGAEMMNDYLPLLKDKNVGLVVNQSSLVNNKHLVDTLLNRDVQVAKIFAPEHGFRGKADAGEKVKTFYDTQTNLPVYSLYGDTKKPTVEMLKGLDVVVFDIQDVGVRFYTFISTMHYVMEACAENNIACIILDRPNPNGDYFDGPVLEKKFQSFVGLDPIPIVHGLTVGELAEMINGEGWLSGGVKCKLKVIKMKGYNHSMHYELPVKPSPNLPNYLSVRLFPSLCFFEATQVSIGRGTNFPFQVIGYPNPKYGKFVFTPISIEGMAKKPLQQDKKCYGVDLRKESDKHRFTLKYIIDFAQLSGGVDSLVTDKRWFNLLAGNDVLIQQLKEGKSENEIRLSWQPELEKYGQLRKKYLLYKAE